MIPCASLTVSPSFAHGPLGSKKVKQETVTKCAA